MRARIPDIPRELTRSSPSMSTKSLPTHTSQQPAPLEQRNTIASISPDEVKDEQEDQLTGKEEAYI